MTRLPFQSAAVCLLVLWTIETGAQIISPNIFNGKDAVAGRYPYLVSLRTPDNRQSHFCAGALIADDTVLTAAHCLDPMMGGFANPVLHIGRVCTRCDNEFGYLIANTAETLIHPSWTGSLANGGDLAYIRLDRQLTNAPVLRVRPQRNPEKFDWKTLGFAGWGLTRINKGLPGQLQEADLPYVKPDECERRYESLKFKMPVPKEKICAGGEGVEACIGDSGGPLILKGETWQKDLGVGVLSAGSPGCGINVELPALFTRLASYREFTRNVLGIVPKTEEEKEQIRNTRKRKQENE